MADIMGIALSGLTAGTKRMDASASNVANARVTGAVPGSAAAQAQGALKPYAPIGVSQSSQDSGNQPGGTRATFTPITPSWVAEVDQDQPYADTNGVVAAPNVDYAKERVEQIAASNAYSANLATIKTGDAMTREAINLKA